MQMRPSAASVTAAATAAAVLFSAAAFAAAVASGGATPWRSSAVTAATAASVPRTTTSAGSPHRRSSSNNSRHCHSHASAGPSEPARRQVPLGFKLRRDTTTFDDRRLTHGRARGRSSPALREHGDTIGDSKRKIWTTWRRNLCNWSASNSESGQQQQQQARGCRRSSSPSSADCHETQQEKGSMDWSGRPLPRATRARCPSAPFPETTRQQAPQQQHAQQQQKQHERRPHRP